MKEMENTPTEQPQLSKKALKKIEKSQRWEAKKAFIKQQTKEKRKLKRKEGGSKNTASYTHLNRFNLVDKELNPVDEGPRLSKEEKKQMFKQLCKKGPKIVVDCEFDTLMLEREKKSLGQQIAYVHNINKQ
jgi:tRNA (guanine9-N1)-methyltransferase